VSTDGTGDRNTARNSAAFAIAAERRDIGSPRRQPWDCDRFNSWAAPRLSRASISSQPQRTTV